MEQIFQASRITKGNFFFPVKIIVEDDRVTFYKGRVIGNTTTSVARNSIGSVSVNAGLFFSEIVVETNGGQVSRANGFSKSDAKKLRELLSK